jgi:hypothetical protein
MSDKLWIGPEVGLEQILSMLGKYAKVQETCPACQRQNTDVCRQIFHDIKTRVLVANAYTSEQFATIYKSTDFRTTTDA